MKPGSVVFTCFKRAQLNEEFNSNIDISIFINLRYLRLKLVKNTENNKKICHIFHHNFKNIPCYVMSEVSLKRFYFAIFDDGLNITLKTLKFGFEFKLFKYTRDLNFSSHLELLVFRKFPEVRIFFKERQYFRRRKKMHSML